MVYKCFFFATWIFYAVLNDLSADVAVALQQPLERISVEMVFAAYIFSSAHDAYGGLRLRTIHKYN